MPKELENLVEMPESVAHCWHWFLDLNNSRASGFGISPISYLEIQAYFNLMQLEVDPSEIEVIKMFDRIAMEVASEQPSKAEKKNKTK